MKAFQLVAPHKAELRDVDVPEPGPGEVLLQITGSGVCHSDLHLLHTDGMPYPMTLGHEGAGRVAALGPGVTGWEIGRHALAYIAWGCGLCRRCAVGADNACERFSRRIVPGPGLGLPGAMADYLLVPARFLVPLGDLDPVDSAPLADAGLTPYHAVARALPLLTPSATAVVIGVGGLGHLAVQILRAITGSRIVAVDVDPAKLAAAEGYGADEAVPSTPTPPPASWTSPRGAGPTWCSTSSARSPHCGWPPRCGGTGPKGPHQGPRGAPPPVGGPDRSGPPPAGGDPGPRRPGPRLTGCVLVDSPASRL
jgi:alcohol dehydrogenase, propanol-preferring